MFPRRPRKLCRVSIKEPGIGPYDIHSDEFPTELGMCPFLYNGFVVISLTTFTQEMIEKYRAMAIEPDLLRFAEARFSLTEIMRADEQIREDSVDINRYGISYAAMERRLVLIDPHIECIVAPDDFLLAEKFFGDNYGDIVEVVARDVPGPALDDYPEYDFSEQHPEYDPSEISAGQKQTLREIRSSLSSDAASAYKAALGLDPFYKNGFVILSLVDYSPDVIEYFLSAVSDSGYLRFTRAWFSSQEIDEDMRQMANDREEIMDWGIPDLATFVNFVDPHAIFYVHPSYYFPAVEYCKTRYGEVVQVIPAFMY